MELKISKMATCRYYRTYLDIVVSLIIVVAISFTYAQTNSKNNGVDEQPSIEMTTAMADDGSAQGFDYKEVVRICNASFTVPLEYMQRFNETAELPNTTDKTGMCFMRCYMENAGLLRNWQLNRALIMQTMWPATGDSIPVCQNEGSRETCPCKRAYAIAKCLMIRALVDARNKPIV
ncbi:general odorant-binding protein 84a-like [Anastrepha ludens]|uniref:Odorant binding protein 84a n=1 Tax=Anastrepha ludens TaxID=28586 RepID=A0A9E8IIB0_9MUSC|nr:general odorant-binding protein 84a-like [Anastrepha ludens]UZH23339.1 odorant binding protein 84a [Anastrepha ludens]